MVNQAIEELRMLLEAIALYELWSLVVEKYDIEDVVLK